MNRRVMTDDRWFEEFQPILDESAVPKQDWTTTELNRAEVRGTVWTHLSGGQAEDCYVNRYIKTYSSGFVVRHMITKIAYYPGENIEVCIPNNQPEVHEKYYKITQDELEAIAHLKDLTYLYLDSSDSEEAEMQAVETVERMLERTAYKIQLYVVSDMDYVDLQKRSSESLYEFLEDQFGDGRDFGMLQSLIESEATQLLVDAEDTNYEVLIIDQTLEIQASLCMQAGQVLIQHYLSGEPGRIEEGPHFDDNF